MPGLSIPEGQSVTEVTARTSSADCIMRENVCVCVCVRACEFRDSQ